MADDSIVRGASENSECYRHLHRHPLPPTPPLLPHHPPPRRHRRRSHRHLRLLRLRRRLPARTDTTIDGSIDRVAVDTTTAPTDPVWTNNG